jgi:hypothetical protein
MPSTDFDFLGQILHDAVTQAAAAIAATQKQIADASDKMEAESLTVQRRLSVLTAVLALAALLQAIATGWPYLGWWLGQHGIKFG